MSKWTLWFLVAAFIAFTTIAFKYYNLRSFALSDEQKKKAVLDFKIISKLETIKYDPKKLDGVTKSLPLKEFYDKNSANTKIQKSVVTETGATN